MALLKYFLILGAAVLLGQAQDEVEVREPATIVIAPAQPEHTSGGRLTLTCAAYGEPLPTVTWSNARMGVTNFSEVVDDLDNVSINTTVIDGRFVVSLLEFCNVNYTTSPMLGGFVCEAENGVTDRPPLGQSRVMIESLEPIAQVPATLLSSPSGRYSYQGTGLVAQCIAYGSPRPEITWSAPSLQISDFEEAEASGMPLTVVTEDAIVDGLVVTYSTLHFCPSTLAMLSPYVAEIQCSTTNGLTNTFGQQMASFTPAPFIQILAFDVRISASPNLTFTFSGNYDPLEHGCFLNKLIFVNNPSNPSIQFTPQYSGRCVRQSSTIVVAMMDSRDYLAAYNRQFFRNANIYVATNPLQVTQFAPPLQIEPISIANALLVTSFVPNVLPPTVTSFDMDFINSLLLIHFDSFVIASTFSPLHFTLQGTALDSQTGQRVMHTFTSSQPTSSLENVRTVCVRLSTGDMQLLTEASICTTRDNCAAYFTPDLVDGLNGNSATDRPPTNSLPVNRFRRNLPNTERGLYMNLTLTYVGCETTVRLSEDEIYIPRVGEYITRIDCFADGEMGNSFPELFYEGGTVSGMTLDWPLHVYYSYPGGVAVDQPGRYECETRSRDRISHHLVTENPYLRIVEGDTITVRLYDELPLTVFFAINPPVVLQRTEIRLVNSRTMSAPSVEPTITFVSDFMATVVFERAMLSLNGMYDVQIIHDSQVIAQTDLNIIVNPPLVSVFPPVATILPGQENIQLRCQTNSNQLPILWVAENLVTELSNSADYTVPIPAQGGFADFTAFTCIVRDPENSDPSANNIIGRAVAYVRNILDTVVILRDGTTSLPNGQLQAATSNDVNLQCLGDAITDNTNLMWIAVRDGEEAQEIITDSEFFRVQYNLNEANLTVVNSGREFLGKLRCYSPITGISFSITFVEQIGDQEACPGMTPDPMWGIQWDLTVSGSQDVQPCPRIDRIQTFGFASRRCGLNGEWEATVDTTGCNTAIFNDLQSASNDLTQTKDEIADDELRGKLMSVTTMLSNVSTPRSEGSHFPADLHTANQVANDIIDVLRESITDAIPIELNTELVKVFDNLLDTRNTDGWRQSQTRFNASSMLLDNIEQYGVYLAEALTSPVVDTSQYVTGINFVESNIEYEVRTGRNTVNFPSSSSPFYSSARITIPGPTLTNQGAQSVASIVVNNLQMFLPEQMENNKTAQAVTPVISSQICGTSCSKRTFTGSNFASFIFTTIRTIGASNPRCVFWDAAQNKWSTEGVETSTIRFVENGEFKSFSLACLSNHLTSFAVIADVEVPELTFYTVPIFIGCGVVIFAAFFALFAMILSCLIDSIRQYFTVAFLTHVSFIFSVLAAYATYLVGVEMAAEERASCVAVAGILHYFFTAAFAWLFCESLIIMLFGWVSKRCGAFVLFLLIGWGLPAIPTAISLGIINDDYGTTSHCWFYFDGVFQTNIVMAFIIPSLVILLMIIVFQVMDCFKMWSFLIKKNVQKSVKKHTGRLLWYLWWSNVLFAVLLSASWVFAMLYVNIYALDPVVLGWVFMACSTLLGIYIFMYSIIIVLLNQKVDYEYMYQRHTGLTYVRDPMKGSTYEMMDLPIGEGPVSRPRIIIPNPAYDDRYPSAYPSAYNDGDDMQLIDVDLEAHDDEERLNAVSNSDLGDGGDEGEEGEEEEEEGEDEEESEFEASSDDGSSDAEGDNTYIDD